MPESPRYSIAVCNYNMAETLDRSLRSMIDQVDDRFEVVVVDGGSTDGSQSILDDLADEYDRLRWLEGDGDYLGGDRNVSFEAARGDYVLESLDTDDCYFDGVIEDFVTVFRALDSAVDRECFLSGTGINAAPRDLLLDVPYYDLGGAEDRDFWRRLIDRDALIWLDHGPVSEQIGYDMDLADEIRRDLHGKICDFQSGITLASALRWSLAHDRYYVLERERSVPAELLKRPYDFVTHLYAWARARGRERHPAPPGFETKGRLERWITRNRMTLPELEAEYGFAVDRSGFSDAGRRAYCSNTR